MCRSTRSTSSSARTTTFSTRASRPTGGRTSARRSRSKNPSSNIGRMRSPTSRRRTSATSCAAMKAHRARTDWFGRVSEADMRKVMRLLRRDGPLTIRDIDDDVLVEKDHRLGEPQAVEAGAATRLLHGAGDGRRPGGDAEDLRPDRPAFRLGAPAAPGDGGPDRRLCARPRDPRAGDREPRFRLLHGCAAEDGGEGADRGAGAAQGPGAGARSRARRRSRTGRRRKRSNCRRRRAAPVHHPLALRPAGHPAQAPERSSSATSTASRPMCRRRSASSAISRCRSSSATRSSRRST